MAQSAASKEVETLNQLLTLTLDSIAGYREAAAETRNRGLQRCFLRRADDRQAIADQLAETIEALGGVPVREGPKLGAVHRVFLNLRELLPSGDAVVMHEVARGESFLRSRYGKALEGGLLSPRSQEVVRAACESVWSGMRAVPGTDFLAPRIRPRAP
jgi:uncharacterized protein (TIGR02284 family)